MTGLQLEIKGLTHYKAGTFIQQDIGFDLATTTSRIMNLRRRLKVNIVEIGIELIKAKSNLDHGDWEDWVRNDLGWNPSTAAGRIRRCRGRVPGGHGWAGQPEPGHDPHVQ